jgi:hypothetical protein
MKRCALLILLLTVLGSSLACGVVGRSTPEGPERVVPDGVLELVLVDVGEAASNRIDLPAELESDVADLESFGDILQQAKLLLPTGQVTITGGEFDFDDIRNDLRERSYTTASYREYSFLESDDGKQASALLEDDRFLISGDFGAVVDILRDSSRDAGLLWNDDDGELKQAMELAGDGLVITAGKNCQLDNNVGCRAVAWSFSRVEERRTIVEGTAALLFRDATAAAGAAAAIERSIGSNELMTLTQILTDGASITLKVDINRDNFASVEFPVTLGQES